ncbi:hypothetical protein QFC19_004537 [Naganishia cerealis]|uniref:Uncharacterized protein n=1 Tax=Naganishia cerealis TaxID=610337 RepID=A0ACC2VV35_9TREE|nr:hypothetical protein QFC19_004537 [Naganishia cerealis]
MSALPTPDSNEAEGATSQSNSAELPIEDAPIPSSTNDPTPTTAATLDGPVITKRKITRSRIGCFTCRRRKKACDLGKPVCQGCTRLGLECQWPMNYQDTLPKKRVAEALAAAERASGRSETLGSTNRSRSASRIRDLKYEPNASSPAERNGLHRGDSGNDSRASNEQGDAPSVRRPSIVGSAYEDDSWLFPERMSYIHGDPSDMFDIYDESLAPLPPQHSAPLYENQNISSQDFKSHLQHRSSAPGYVQLYVNGHSNSSMLHHPGQPSLNQFSTPQNEHNNSNNQIPLFGDPVNRISHNGAPNAALSFPTMSKGFPNTQTQNNAFAGHLSSTGLALTVEQSYSNHLGQHQQQHRHLNADVSGNISQPGLNNMNNLVWNHHGTSAPPAQINLEDPLMQLLAGGSYPALRGDVTEPSVLQQSQRPNNLQTPSADHSQAQSVPPAPTQKLPLRISAHEFEGSFVTSVPVKTETSLWNGFNDNQRRLRTQILEYYTQTLSKLVSCDHIDQDDVRRDGVDLAHGARRAAGFDVFRSLASSSTSTMESSIDSSSRTTAELKMDSLSSAIPDPSTEWTPAHILHMALLAWAGRHSLNKGEVRHEAASEEWGKRAETMLARWLDGMEEKSSSDLRQAERDTEHHSTQSEGRPEGSGEHQEGTRGEIRSVDNGKATHDTSLSWQSRNDKVSMLTTLAACLMIVQWKNCRGDISGFQSIMARIKALSTKVFFKDQNRPIPGTMEFHFMENLLYKDVLSTSIYVNAPVLDQDALQSYFRLKPTVINTLTGLAWPIFTTMYRVAGLIRKKRNRASQSVQDGTTWRYDELMDLVSEAEKIQQDLDSEKRLIDEVIENHPRLEAHRCLHEAFRLACVLQLRCQVLNEPSTSLPIRLLIRQLLGLLESMMKQNLPGWCSCHWVQFQTALYCLDIKCENGQSDRDRINVLYDRTFRDLAFLNVPRSHKVVQEVWRRSDAEGRQVDWLDVLQEWDWDLYLV